MITEDYVSFEIAKLLKEKGFDKAVLITDWWYDAEGQAHKRGNYSYGGAPFYDKETCFNCPALQMAMKWLREKHCIIVVNPTWFTADGCKKWSYSIWADDNLEVDGENPDKRTEYDSYEEACEAAIKYCLDLI